MSVAPKLNWAARLESWKGMVAAVMLVTGGDWSSVNTLESCSVKPAQALGLRRRMADHGCMPCRTCCEAGFDLPARLAPGVVIQMDRAG